MSREHVSEFRMAFYYSNTYELQSTNLITIYPHAAAIPISIQLLSKTLILDKHQSSRLDRCKGSVGSFGNNRFTSNVQHREKLCQ